MSDELPPAAIADAGPLIHLDELGVLDVLAGFAEVLVPSVVAAEASYHRPGWDARAPTNLRTADPEPDRVQALLASAHLDPGEAAALALWQEHAAAILLCDDLAARRHAEALGCPIAGTLGLLLRAVRTGRIERERALQLIFDIPDRSTLHIAPALLSEAARSLDDLSAPSRG